MISFRGALLFLVGTAAFPMLSFGDVTPKPRQVPLNETVHGIAQTDEYRWMEDPATKPEWTRWVGLESQRTREMLDALPTRAEFAGLISTTSSSLIRQGGYQRAGKTEIWSRTLPGEQVPKLIVRDDAGVRVLVDPARVTGNALSAMGSFSLSPDGRTVAVHLSVGGSEVGNVRFFDTGAGKETHPAISNMWGERSATFLPGNMLAYTQMAAIPVENDPLKGMTAWLRPLTGGKPVKLLGMGYPGADVTISELPTIFYSALSPIVLGVAGGARADLKLFATTRTGLLAGKPVWVQFSALADNVYSAAVRGRNAYLITAKTNSARDLVMRPLDGAGRPGAEQVLMRGTDQLILQELAPTRDGLYVFASTDGVMRVFYLPNATGVSREVKLPFEGTLSSFAVNGEETELLIGLAGWTKNGVIYRVRGTNITPVGVESGSWNQAADIAVERYEAVSADGTKVPLVVTRLKSATGRVPTLVEAYGAYGIDTATPFYNRNGMAFIAKGGAMAYCGVRGGGERGRAWHEGGRGPNKPRGQEDLIACAETLTANGIAPTQGPVVIGSSAAGALVPGAALRKPAAFGGMIVRVGIVNATRLAVAENGANQMSEMGNPADPKQFADLVAMDAYQMISSAGALPPTMMLIGMNDRRVSPWMTAKFVARAQAKWPDTPIWLRSDDRAGHGIGSTEDVRRDEWADIFAFTWAQQRP